MVFEATFIAFPLESTQTNYIYEHLKPKSLSPSFLSEFAIEGVSVSCPRDSETVSCCSGSSLHETESHKVLGCDILRKCVRKCVHCEYMFCHICSFVPELDQKTKKSAKHILYDSCTNIACIKCFRIQQASNGNDVSHNNSGVSRKKWKQS